MLEPVRDKRGVGNHPVQGHIPPGFVFQIAAADIGVHARETYLLEIQAAVDSRSQLAADSQTAPSRCRAKLGPEREEDAAECGIAEQDGTN
ncbi:hypothetical protein LRP30_33160 [Bradyrhizobium sp. C-145]|uniref:hypothetical protein n=1 Tax=Bradyrhizobium sp. C-145 TaxID=574727 RepID=UPI00201B4B88|nr:hypothetical protein [Bradyrhizobium sp. C-145]UQR61634.1 hypothetical protein LRP30_33160 [Bradyrhizobium sp. C-145]